MAYTELPIVPVAVTDLFLDLENYRIPVRPDDEVAALAFLIAAEDVLTMVRQLLRDGYFDNEVPVVVEELVAIKGKKKPVKKFVVLEGNRRVSALKLIQDPSLVPQHQTEVEQLLTRYARELSDVPATIRVIVAPDRGFARPHVGRLHTGLSKRAWKPDQQAKFYHSLLGPDVTFDDLRATYPDVEIQRLLRMAEMRRFLTGVKFKDASLHDYVSGPDLLMSAFEYAYRPPDIAQTMGIEFEGYQIKPHRKSAAAIGAGLTVSQRGAVEILMQGFRAKVFNTRSPEFKKDTQEREDLLEALWGRRPAKPAPGTGGASAGGAGGSGSAGGGASGSGTAGGGTGSPGSGAGTGGTGATGGTSGGRGPNNPDTKRGLPIGGFDLTKIPSNLERRYLELRKVDVKDTPAAAAMLLRSVLEATTKLHFSGTPHHVSGELGKCVDAIVAIHGKDRTHKNVIQKVKSGNVTVPGSLAWFNAVAHDANFPVDDGEVRKAYSLVESLLKLLLVPYVP